MQFELGPYHRNIPEDELVADLRAVAERFPDQPLTHALYNEHGRFHSATLHSRLGGWEKALALVGRQRPHPYAATTEELFANLESIWRQLGRPPRQIDMVPPLSRYGAHLYARRFGGYRKALEAFVIAINAHPNGRLDSDPNTPPTPVHVMALIHKTSRTITWRLRFLALRRDGFRCCACGHSPANEPGVKLHVDHVIPWTAGGETVLENLQCLCESCNCGKSNLNWKAKGGASSAGAPGKVEEPARNLEG
jgi:hypothetical protein